jgi:putative colanic acid biosynthesis acetyltransferase WcaF
METDLSKFDNRWYRPGPAWKRALWYPVNVLFFRSGLNPFSGLKVMLLRLFGAGIGQGVVVKPCVNIKYPWILIVGDHSWIGEEVWIDNLAQVRIGSNVCISQRAMLLCGNHNFRKSSFDLMVSPITLEDGVWIGAGSIVCPGVTCHSHAVLSVGSVATHDMEAYSVYQGNPAAKIRDREIIE